MKFFLSGVFTLVACVSLHAAEIGENGIVFLGENVLMSGEEYLFVKSADTPSGRGDSSIVFIAKNAKIYDKEHLFIKQNIQQAFTKKGSKTKITHTTTESTKDNVVKNEPKIIVFPDFPFRPSSSFYSSIDERSGLVSKQKYSKSQSIGKKREDAYLSAKDSNLSLCFFEQRQKFSPAATQCGILTSFSPNSPSS